MLYLHVDNLIKFYVKGKKMVWFFQSLKNNDIAMRKKILQDLSTIEYAMQFLSDKWLVFFFRKLCLTYFMKCPCFALQNIHKS